MRTDTAPKAPTICCCMIVKNEGQNLPRVLGSVKALVDRVVVVDTGSDDGSPEVARELGAEVYLHPWPQEKPFDFSAARNIAQSYAREDWILVMDGDDELEPADVGLVLRLAQRDDVDCWCFLSISTNAAGVEAGTHWLPRLYRNGKGFHYEGRVHNQLKTTSPQTCAGVRVYHYGYGLKPAEMRRKWRRSARLLARALREEPGNYFQHYNFAVVLSNLKREGAALKHLQIVIDRSAPESEVNQAILLMCLYLKAQIKRRQADRLSELKKWEKAAREYALAEAACLTALDIDNGFPDCLMLLGELINRRGNEPLAAVKVCRQYLTAVTEMRARPRPHNLIINTMNLDYAGYYQLGRAYFKSAQVRGTNGEQDGVALDFRMAADNFQRAVYKAPDNINFKQLFELYGCLAFCLMQCGSFDAGIETYRSMLRVMPRPHPEILNNMGTAYGRLNKPRQARECYRKALDIDPNYAAARHNLRETGGEIAARDSLTWTA